MSCMLLLCGLLFVGLLVKPNDNEQCGGLFVALFRKEQHDPNANSFTEDKLRNTRGRLLSTFNDILGLGTRWWSRSKYKSFRDHRKLLQRGLILQ